MAAKDAEMPTHHALGEEVETIARHLATLRKDIEDLAGSIERARGACYVMQRSHPTGRSRDWVRQILSPRGARHRQRP